MAALQYTRRHAGPGQGSEGPTAGATEVPQQLAPQPSGDSTPLYLQASAGAGLEQQAQPAEAAFAAADPSSLQYATTGITLRYDAEANRLAQAKHAEAFTAGSAIFFNQGRYNPSSTAGGALIGHELTHVHQQRAGLAQGIQRKTLADAPEADRKKLEMPSSELTLEPDKFDEYFEKDGDKWGATYPAPDKVKVELAGIDKAFLIPMTSVAMQLSNVSPYKSPVAGNPTQTFGPGKTVTLFLRLAKYKLADANFRFTWTGTATSGVIYIERLSGGVASENSPALNTAQNALTVGSLTFDVAGLGSTRIAVVQSALALVPLSALQTVDKLKFRMGSTSDAANPAEDAHYDEPSHTVLMLDKLFDPSDARHGVSDKAVTGLAHEIGHAVDLAPLHAAALKYAKSRKDSDMTAALSESNSKWTLAGSKNFKLDDRFMQTDGAFRTAAAQDGVAKTSTTITEKGKTKTIQHLKGGPTDYSNVNWLELYADSFALYTTDPATLKLIRPNIAAYFEKRFPRKATP